MTTQTAIVEERNGQKVAVIPETGEEIGVLEGAPEPTGLYAKLLDVMKGEGKVKKSGRNDFHNYDYVTEADLLDVLRPALAKAGIVVVPSVADYSEQWLDDGTHHVRLGMDYTLIDAETGQSLVLRFYGEAEDKGDKATYKAYTGCQKYFLAKAFLVATEDDPEADARTDERASKRSPSAPAAIPDNPLDWVFPVGKHKGRTVTQVLGDAPDYVDWAMKNMDKMPAGVKDALAAEAEDGAPDADPAFFPPDDQDAPF